MTLYFAYGSNLDGKQMKKLCPGSQLKGIAKLQEYSLVFPRYSTKRKGGVASIEKSEDDCVWGALYELTKEDIINLDRHEGVPNAYMREDSLEGKLPNDEKVLVFTYVANKTGSFQPHRSYIEQIVRDARQVGLPQVYIEKLENIRCMGEP